jgi:hypothetical protein
MSIKINKIDFLNFGECLEVKNDTCTLIITTEIGPRIIGYFLNSKENVFFEDVNREISYNKDNFCDVFGKDEKWYIYGGHRLWISPEFAPFSYYPDNEKVSYEIENNTIILTPKAQRVTNVAMSMSVTLDETSSKVTVVHKVKNLNLRELTFAPWSLSVMAKGGVEILPQPDRKTGLLANRTLALWDYSNMADERVFWGEKYITLKQDINANCAFKLGISGENGWASYLNKGQMFIKRYDHILGANYPDGGMSYETYTNEHMLEIETIGELKNYQSGEEAVHTENWELIECNDTFNPKDETQIEQIVNKYIK